MWGSSPALTKIAVQGFAPIEIVFYRLVVGAAILWTMMTLKRARLPFGRRYLLFYLVAAIFGSALPWFLISWGQTTVPSGLTAILFAIMPLATIVLAHFVVPGERLGGARVAGFVVGFIGIIMLVGPEALAELFGKNAILFGQLAILSGALCYSINMIASRIRPACDPLVAATGTLSLSLLITLPTMLIFGEWRAFDLSAPPGLAIIALGIFGTAVPTILFFRLITSTGTAFTALINYLIPVWGFLLGVSIMSEPLQLHAAFALALILSGIMLSEWRRE